MIDWDRRPGFFLGEELAERGWSQKLLAEKTGLDSSMVSRLLSGDRFSPRIALLLEDALGVSAEYWMTLQVAWDLDRARQKMKGETDDNATTGLG